MYSDSIVIRFMVPACHPSQDRGALYSPDSVVKKTREGNDSNNGSTSGNAIKQTQRKRILFAILTYLPIMRTVCCYVRQLELINQEHPMHA